ncbi:MAG: choice-of-anchor D domain-containing protein [candidate division WOR-3 bacterium]
MLRLIITLFVSFSIIFAQSVIHAVPAPRNASGLCWDGRALWCGAYGTNGDTIYKVNPEDGTILRRIFWRNYADCYGLAFDTILGGGLWVADHFPGTDSIWFIDTITGLRRQAIKAQREYMAGLANDGDALWHGVYYNPDGRVYKINKSTGNALDSIELPNLPQIWGATWDGNYLWLCNDGNYGGGHRVYKIDVIQKIIVDSINSPGTRPFGLAWDGRYLWVLANGTSPTGKVLYQINLTGGGTPVISVSPTSYNFSNVPIGSTSSFNVTINNIGTDTLTVDTIFSTNPAFSYAYTTFPLRILPSQSTILNVTFSPTQFGDYVGNLGIISNDPVRETVYVTLSGRGVYLAPTLAVNFTTYNYGNVRLNCVKDFYLRIVNQGYQVLQIDSLCFSNTRFFYFGLTLPRSLTCLETCYVQIITRPASLGNYQGELRIYSNSPTSPTSILLEAIGISNIVSAGGEVLWDYEFEDDVICVAQIDDINNDGILDVCAEAYGTEMYGRKHLRSFWANSSGTGVTIWQVGSSDFTGAWGDDCLTLGDDYNRDGIRDIILGTAWGDRKVYVLNGRNGNIIWFYDTRAYDGEGGWVYSVKAMPDITGDGIGEVLAGVSGNQTAGGGPRSVYCFNGATGGVIWQFRALDAIGCVNWIPDVNNDGVPDVIAGAWGNSYDKRVFCISGASTGMVTNPIWQYQCNGDVQAVIAIPDINGDGKWEVAAGSWDGYVRCLSGANGGLLWATNVGGLVVKLMPIRDLISQNRPGIAVANVMNVTSFNVLNSANGNIYWSYPTGGNIWSVDSVGDLDNDAKPDIVIGTQSGIVYCLSGSSGSLLWQYNAGLLINTVRSIADVSFDGYPDILVGTQGHSITNIGRLIALAGGHSVSGIKDSILTARLLNVLKINFLASEKELKIRYQVLHPGKVLLELYNALGGKLQTLLANEQIPGIYELTLPTWSLPAGIYYIKYQNHPISLTKKTVIFRK